MQHRQTPVVGWEGVKAVIFDVDGTLYDQSKLRKKMLFDLLSYYAKHPWRYKELSMLSEFRNERENRAGFGCPDLDNAQYTWCAEKRGYPVHKLKSIVQQWIFQRPIRYLAGCVYPGASELFKVLRQNNIRIAIYSDYPAHDKLMAMGLTADLLVSSTDPEINQLKPDPKGLLYAVDQLGLSAAECLFIGDRQEMDGECALRAGVPYLIIDKKPYSQFDFYSKLIDDITSKTQQYETQRIAF
ncbi:HAD family hydrolase [Pontibacter toksunensis]|uniref:phosphoglycolate phosphatase n=1 Tax=Pontibacter toksunensis TaxID=1332631 RepID=A0ABW6BVA5_9BACT